MKKLFVLLGLVFFPWQASLAVKVASLYQAELPVTSQAVDDRDQATKQGFLQVLIKLSGDTRIEKNYAVKSEIARADYYVQDFSYSAPTTASSQYFIKIRFDKDALNDLLHKAGVSYWGDMRPLILVWMTMTTSSQAAEIIGNDSPQPLLDDLKITAKKYGLPVIFPVLDATELATVSPTDIQQAALPVLQPAGQRYAPDALLVGQVMASAQGYSGTYELLIGKDKSRYEVSAKTTEQLADALFNQVSQTLAHRYVEKQDAAPPQWLRLIVSNVKKEKDFRLLMLYLKESGCVKQAQLSEVKGDSVGLLIELDGSLDKFMQTALEDEHLVFRDQDKYSNTLTYEWVR